MKRIVFFILVIIFQQGTYLMAQTLSLEQARALGLANSRSLAKYNLAIQNSLLNEKSQLYTMLPTVSANYSASMDYLNKDWGFVNPVDTFSAGANFAVTQKIFEGGKSLIQKAISSIATESVRKDALAEYFNVLDAVDNAYYAVLEAAASLETAESSLQTANLSLSVAEIRQASGMINQGDYLKALADKESRENSRNQARRDLTLSTTKLKSFIGLKESPELVQVDFASYENVIRGLAEISDAAADTLYNKLWKVISQANPSLARAALNSQTAEKNLSIAKRDISPTLSATVFSTGLSYSKAKGFGTATGGGVTLSGYIPIDFWVRSNKIEKSKIAVNSAALDYIGAEISLETEVQSALLNIFAQAGSVLSSRRALDYAEKHLEYVMERYRLSQSSVSDVSDASVLASSSRAQFIRSQYGFLQSLSKLRSLGAMDDEERLIKSLLGDER
jgi:outer membrane protein TolC